MTTNEAGTPGTATSATPLPTAVGFIGLGAMGYRMAANLRKRLAPDAEMYIYDVVPAVLQQFSEEHHAVVCRSAAEVVGRSNCIISIVPEGKHVLSVFSTGTGGALSNPATVRGKLFVESSTIDVATSRKVTDAVVALGGIFVDAPVSGGTAGADAATLTFMMGLAADSPRAPLLRRLLGTMGRNIVACGGPTLGLVAKVCNNYISGTIAIATAEGFNLAMQLGMDPRVFREVLLTSSGGSWVNASCNPVPGVDPAAPSSNGYAPGFKVQLMKKDYGLACDAGRLVGAQLNLGPAGLDVYSRAADDPRCVDRDSRVVYRLIGGDEEWQGKIKNGSEEGAKGNE